jgi:Ala-tRNA(Pro) deacylase
MLKRLTQFLDTHNTRYVVVIHSPAFTAQEIAARAHVPGRELAKTVMAKVDDTMTMLVLPASSMVNFTTLRQEVSANRAELATETEFKGLFPECEVGAMPPFGNLFGIPVLVDRALLEDEEIAFNAGSHKELVRLSYADFARLVEPRVLSFGIKKRVHEEELR